MFEIRYPTKFVIEPKFFRILFQHIVAAKNLFYDIWYFKVKKPEMGINSKKISFAFLKKSAYNDT